MDNLKFEHITATYGKKKVLDDFSLEVSSNEILCLVGPSGCGKTTLVRCLLGLMKPDKGRISIGDKVFFDSEKHINVPAEQRNIGIVFQDYAVWPHMTVIDNVMYPLKKRNRVKGAFFKNLFKKDDPLKKQRREQAMKALELVNMTQYADYLPSQLSGGQQQRVAIARALVVDSDILVMDEPITNLDAKLREQMLSEIRIIQKRLGSTILYITHDQQSALQLCDKMAIMEQNGTLCQYGTDDNIILNPANRFVFEFIGTSNFIPVEKTDDDYCLVCGNKKFKFKNIDQNKLENVKGLNRFDMGVRLNDVFFDSTSPIKAKVLNKVFLGSEYNYFLLLGDLQIRMQQSMLDAKLQGVPNDGDEVGLKFVNPRFYPSSDDTALENKEIK